MLGQTLQRFCPCREAVTHRQRPDVSLALCCMLGQYLTGSALALRLLHTARGLALAWHSAECWGSTLEGFVPALRLPPWWRKLTCSEDGLWFLSMAEIVGITTAGLALVAYKTENIGLPDPHPFPGRWTTWGRSRQDHPTSRGPVPFAARVV